MTTLTTNTMFENYTGLSAQQVESSQQLYSTHLSVSLVKNDFWNKVVLVSRFWLIQIVGLLLLSSVFLLLLLEIIIGNLSCSYGWIVLILSVLLIFAYGVMFLSAHGTKKNRYYEQDPLVTILLIILFVFCLIGYYRSVFLGEVGLSPYLEAIFLALFILPVATLIYFIEHKISESLHTLDEENDTRLIKVLRDNDILEVPQYDVVVGDIIMLQSGDRVPADAELLESSDLIVSERLQCVDYQVSKSSFLEQHNTESTIPTNQLIKGSTIINGEAIALVFAIGNSTID